ncbi:MAG: RNA polymerase-associated protein rapA, partial [Candidatus Thioglobus sp.]
VNNYDGNESYTQRDALREAYVDTALNEWSIRAGKQQVVWGTADGMKLLDMINPSDYGEMAQNQMEDSRIPVWMINAEKTNEDGSEFQIIASQPKENIFAGLNRNIDTSVRTNGALTGAGPLGLSYAGNTGSTSNDRGHAFIMKGVDSITGSKNGFLNIVPDLGTVASLFGRAFTVNNASDQTGLNVASYSNAAMNAFTVGSFNTSTTLADYSTSFNGVTSASGGTAKNFTDTNLVQTAFWTGGAGGGASTSGQAALMGFAGMFGGDNGTNLHNTGSAVDSTFEYMDRTSFSTFDAFVGATSQYKYSMPTNSDADVSLRYKNSTPEGVNYSLNYSNAYDKNPIIDLSWVNTAGEKLTVNKNNNVYVATSKYLTLTDSASNAYGGYAADLANGNAINGAVDASRYAILQFDQKVKRIQNIGGSVDMAVETKGLGPVVLRGEALYQKDVYSPVMDRGAMAIGDLPAALTMRKGDRFKYVLGADVTALTNMMVSVQFIQDRNLDYIDNNVDFDGTACDASALTAAGFKSENCGVYTADYATMHMTNGFNKAEENKEFYSLFFSKPFGASGEHRWNNITMYEENGGKWNRLDAEFSIDDDTQATVEFNKYWGNENTQFGQLAASSNIQVGVKYSF